MLPLSGSARGMRTRGRPADRGAPARASGTSASIARRAEAALEKRRRSAPASTACRANPAARDAPSTPSWSVIATPAKPWERSSAYAFGLERCGARSEAAVDRVPHHDAGDAGPDRVAKAFELLAPYDSSYRLPAVRRDRRRAEARKVLGAGGDPGVGRGRGRTQPQTRHAESGATRAGRPASRGQARGRRRHRRGPAPVPPPARYSARRGRSGSSLLRRRAGAPDRHERDRPPDPP